MPNNKEDPWFDEWFNESFIINTEIHIDYHREIQEFIYFFTKDYKWAVESGYTYINSLPIMQQLGMISDQLSEDTHIQYAVIMETMGPYLWIISGRHLVLTVAKLLESPKGRHEHENRSFCNIFSWGYKQGYISKQLEQAFRDIKQQNKALIQEVQDYRSSIAHSLAGENLVKPELAEKIVNFLEDEIRSLYGHLMQDWCPGKHAAIRLYGAKVQHKSDIAPRDTKPDLQMLNKIHTEKLQLFNACKKMGGNEEENNQILKERAWLLYQNLFGIQIHKEL